MVTLPFDPLEIDPIIIIIASAILYACVTFVRAEAASLLVGLIGVLCLGFLFLPSGKASLDAAHRLPSRISRVECLGLEIAHGAPFSSGAPDGVAQCHFTGTGVGDPDPSKVRQITRDSRTWVR